LIKILLVIAVNVLGALISSYFFFRCCKGTKEVSDKLSIDTKPHPFSFKKNPKDPINELIIEAVNRMGGVGENAETEYQAILKKLLTVSEKAIPIIIDEYNTLPETNYLDRWSLIQLLAEIEHESTLKFLDKVIVTPLPPERSKKPSEFSTKAEELIIRTTAIEALKRLAIKKHDEAVKLLLKHTKHEVFSIKRAAIQGYLEVDDNDPRKELLRILPKKDHYILDIKRVDVKEVQQPEPEKDLKQPEYIDVPGEHPYRPPKLKREDSNTDD